MTSAQIRTTDTRLKRTHRNIGTNIGNWTQELNGMLAYTTDNKQARDPSGRFTSKNRVPATITTTSTAEKTLPTSTDSTRPSSRLSGTYELITSASQITTPFSSSPITLQNSLPPTTTETEDMAAEVITPFHGDKEDENPEDFLRAFYRRMGDKSDDTKKAQFPYYLQADSVADEWYTDLGNNEKKAWEDIETAFRKRWPRKSKLRKQRRIMKMKY